MCSLGRGLVRCLGSSPLPPAEELEAGSPESLRKQAQRDPGLVRAKLCSLPEYLHRLPGKGRERQQREEKDRKIHTCSRKERERGRKRVRERGHSQHSTDWMEARIGEGGGERQRGHRDRNTAGRRDSELWGETKGTEGRANPDSTLSQVPTSTACLFEANFIKE